MLTENDENGSLGSHFFNLQGYDMIFEPKQKNKVPEVTVLALFLCAGIAYAFSAVEAISGRGILQLLAVALFVAMVFIAVRYKFTSFRYVVRKAAVQKKSLHHDDEDGDSESELAYEGFDNSIPVTSLPPSALELVIERRQGSGKWGTECVLKLSEIYSCSILPEHKDEFERISAENKKVGKYKYFRNLVAPDQTAILANSPTGKVMVFIETEKKLSEYLRSVAVFNSENN